MERSEKKEKLTVKASFIVMGAFAAAMMPRTRVTEAEGRRRRRDSACSLRLPRWRWVVYSVQRQRRGEMGDPGRRN